ncbi:MAG: hypothetical protein OEW71_01875, partial [Candidatus Bathyarchaeota archaeon]|nr:hypothetical protein [Candidatus Bathyarchaeota archaeon]
MDAKTVSFTLMMGVLGNVLFAISSYLGNLGYGIALDFSLVAAYIAGFYGGPLTGFVSGLFVGIMPGIMFGPMGMGSWLGLFGLPLGKGLTGLTAGIISRGLGLGRRQYSSLLVIPATLLAYIPECLFTYAYFAYLMPFFLGNEGASIFIGVLLPKAIGEITIISFLMAALIGNQGFSNFVCRFFTKPHIIPKLKASKSD